MDYGKEFQKYATKHLGISSLRVDEYTKLVSQSGGIYGLTPNIIEERQMNASVIDIFSRLMMDRIIFLGVPIYEDVANIIMGQLLFLESANPNRDIQIISTVQAEAFMLVLRFMIRCSTSARM